MIKLPTFRSKKTPVSKIISDLGAGGEGKNESKAAGPLPKLTTVMSNSTESNSATINEVGSAVTDLIAPESIEVDFDHLKIGSTYYRSMFVAGYPRFVSANWLAPIINFDSSMDISMFIYPVESRDILSNLKRKIAEMEATIESDIKRGRVIDPSVQVALDDALAMQEQLAKGAERFFQFGLYITVNAKDMEDLNQLSKQVESTLASLLLIGKKATLQMEEAFKTTQPMCVDFMTITRNMDTTSLATTFPFTSSELTANEGVLYGINEHNDSLIIFDRFSMENANEVVLGKSGGGKSAYSKDYVIIRDSSGIRIEQFETLVNGLFSVQKPHLIEKDIEGVLNPGIEVFTFDKNLKGVWSKVTVAARKNLNRGHLYRVRTKSGREITVTEDHNLIVLRKTKVRAVSTQRVRPGEFLPLSRTLPAQERGIKEFYPKDLVLNWPRQLPSSVPLSRFILMLFGLMTSEGFTGFGHVSVYNIDPYIQQIILQGANELGASTKPIYTKLGVLRGFHLRPQRYFNTLFTALGLAGSSGTKRVPPILFSLSNEQIGHYLRGYFDGDGYVSEKEIACCTKSKALASDLSYLFLRMGIITRIREKFKRATNAASHKGDYYYEVVLSGVRNVQQFEKFVGFSSSKKASRLRGLSRKKGNTNVDVIPTLGPIFQRIYKTLYASSEIKSPVNLSPLKREVFAPSREELLEIVRQIESRIAEIMSLRPKVKTLAELPHPAGSIVGWWLYKKHNRMLGHQLGASWRFMRAHPEAVGTRNFLQAFATISGKTMDLPTVSQTIWETFRATGNSLSDYDQSLFTAITDRQGDTLYGKTYNAGKFIWKKYKSLLKKTHWIERKLAYIKSLASSDLYWDEIVSVEKLKTKEKYVYDLTVDNEVFLAGHGGMFIHNSFLVKLEALRSLMFGAGVIIIDPEEEYEPLTKSVGGDYISFSFSSATHINPFDLAGTNDDPQENDLQYKIGFTLTRLLKIMVGSSTAEEDAILHNALELTYRQKGITYDPSTHKNESPILEDLYKVLVGMESQAAGNLALRLEKYVKGSFGTIFNQRSNIKLNNGFTVFSFKNLEDQVRSLAIFIIVDFVWNSIKRDLRKRILIVDEAWYLMKNQSSAEFLWGFAKRARKYYLGLTTITQDIEDFLSTDLGKTVVTNSSIQILMKQSPAAIDKVAEVFYLSEGEKNLLLSANVGEGLFFAGSSHVAMRVVASPEEYKLVSSNPVERQQAQQAEKLMKKQEEEQAQAQNQGQVQNPERIESAPENNLPNSSSPV